MSLILPNKLQRHVNLARHAKGTRETARLAMDCFDLTSLKGDETREEIFEVCDIAKYNHLASVCIYPDQVRNAQAVLRDSDTIIATVINFSDGRLRTLSSEEADTGTIKLDVTKAIEDGARQIDLVFPRHHFDRGDMSEGRDMLRACREACGEGVTMKVIFETAAFDSSDKLRRACHLAINEGVDCLKTSTGKHPSGGATMEAAAILMDEAEKADRLVGVKISGGIKTNDDCAQYITLARGIRGHNSISREFFRIGASSLIDNLIPVLGRNPEAQVAAPRYNY